LKISAERLLQKLGKGSVMLASVPEAEKMSLVTAFNPGVIEKGLQAKRFVGAISKQCGGDGGDRPNLAQANRSSPRWRLPLLMLGNNSPRPQNFARQGKIEREL
jgi:alanyl-tRNA synthetase